MRKFWMFAVIMAVAVCLSVQDSSALWGKATTQTEDSNMKTDLGAYKGLKKAIGCKAFDNEAGWHGEWELGNNLSIMLESALFDTGRFVMVEREKINDVIAEQDLATSGRTAPSKVAETGKLRAARYLATGAITTVEDSQSGGGGGISFHGIRVGGEHAQAQVTIIAKLIDTTTGEIVAKQSITGKAGKTGVNVGLSVAGLNTDLNGFKKTPLGQAAQDCINQAAVYFAKQMESFPFEGSIVKATGDGQVIINRGSEFGMESGQALTMSTEGETLTDPDSGEVLGKEEGKVIGKIKVDKVLEKISYGTVTEGEKNPAKGTIVKAQ